MNGNYIWPTKREIFDRNIRMGGKYDQKHQLDQSGFSFYFNSLKTEQIEVTSICVGTVVQVHRTAQEEYEDLSHEHNIVLGIVNNKFAGYTHIHPCVEEGDKIEAGQVIGKTDPRYGTGIHHFHLSFWKATGNLDKPHIPYYVKLVEPPRTEIV